MLELLLWRHAKSSWDVDGLADHDRDLSPRGEKAGLAMGKHIRKRKWIPDLVLCSTALRARRTLELAATRLAVDIDTRWLKSIYLASPSRLETIVRRQPSTLKRVAIVGHNPGMHNFALQLIDNKGSKAAAKLEAKFPTGALVRIGFKAGDWSEVSPEGGRLLDYVRPRDLG